MATEDFLTYDETDPDGDLAVTTDRVTASTLDKGEVAHLSDDKGVDHFSGDFEHLFVMFNNSASQNGSEGHPWAVANVQDSSQNIDNANGSTLFIQIFAASTDFFAVIVEIDGGTFNSTAGLSLSDDTEYFCTVERDESIGSFGQLELRVYSDSGRTMLVDSDTLALSTSKKDFRYVYGMQGKGDGSSLQRWNGYCEFLDLQEVVAPEAVITGVGAIDATGFDLSPTEGRATLIGAGLISATPFVDVFAEVTLTGSGEILATGKVGDSADATITGTGEIVATGKALERALATITGAGFISATPGGIRAGAASFTGVGEIEATGFFFDFPEGEATLNGSGFLSAKGRDLNAEAFGVGGRIIRRQLEGDSE